MKENQLTSRDMAKACVNALEDKKGEDITILDISEISTLADYFIMVSGSLPSNQCRLASLIFS